jgi:drug/metabolite transporter (DMT)-like permease
VLPIAAALAGALAYGTGSVLQASAAGRARGPAVLVHRAYLAGLVLDVLAWLSSLYAVRRLPLFTVQAVLASSVVVTVVLAAVVLGDRLRRPDVVATATIVVAIVVLVASAGSQSPGSPPPWLTPVVLASVAAIALTLLGFYRAGGSLVLAAVAGTAFSGAAVCARALAEAGGVRGLLLDPLVWSLVALGLLGALAYARSLERGPVGPATAVLWVVEVVVPGVFGVLALGDHVRPGWALPAAAAVCAAVVASVVMSLRLPTPAR